MFRSHKPKYSLIYQGNLNPLKGGLRNFKHGSLVSNVPSNTHIFRRIPTFRFKLIFTFLPKLPVPSAVSRLDPLPPPSKSAPEGGNITQHNLAPRSARLSPGETVQRFHGPSPGFRQHVEQAQGISARAFSRDLRRAHDRVNHAERPTPANRINDARRNQSIQKSSGRKILPELYLSG